MAKNGKKIVEYDGKRKGFAVKTKRKKGVRFHAAHTHVMKKTTRQTEVLQNNTIKLTKTPL